MPSPEQLVLDLGPDRDLGGDQEVGPLGDIGESRIAVFPDALCVEAAILGGVRRDLAELRRDPSRLAAPLRIVVPSRSLRDHVAAALVASGEASSLAGVRVQTLHGLALEILERTGEPPPRGEPLMRFFVEEAARQEPILAAAFDDLHDGYGCVESSVRDLLDAGFIVPHADALLELLDSEPDAGSAATRANERTRGLAGAVVRTATAVLSAFEREGLDAPAGWLERACDALERDPACALPSRGLWLHGFSDATGAVTRMLETLVRSASARSFLLLPHEFGVAREAAEKFAGRLIEALETAAGSPAERFSARDLPSATSGPSRVEAFVASTPETEVREVASRVRALLDQGCPPEHIGVVARELPGFALALRESLYELAIPFSGVGAPGPGGAPERRRAALCRLLAEGPLCGVDSWLDAFGPEIVPAASRGDSHDVRLRLRVAGALRLTDAAALGPALALALNGESRRLPVPEAIAVRKGRGEGAAKRSTARVAYRRLPETRFASVVAAAVRLVEGLEAWPRRAPLGTHADCLRSLLVDALGWEAAGVDALSLELDALEAEVGQPVAISRESFVRLFGQLCAGLVPSIGGQGGGVQLLGVMEARARTFSHLFVVGLVRDLFPRRVREDPLLPDRLRLPLLALLPDLPIKARGLEEERFLFAQLTGSAASLTFSWHRASAQGQARSPSGFVRRLEAAGVIPDPDPATSQGLGSARRVAVQWAPRAGSGEVEQSLKLGLAAREHALGRSSAPASQLVNARIAVLREADTPPRSGGPLGPYFGFVAPLAVDALDEGVADPRLAPVYVTQLEGLARCSWRYFLERLLRVERLPDPAGGLPEIDPLIVGVVVHDVLEQVVEAAVGAPRRDPKERTLEAMAERSSVALSWPSAEWLAAQTLRAARLALEERGQDHPALRAALVGRVAPFLERARECEFGPDLACLGAEAEGSVRVGDLELFFRADRVDAGSGGLVLTDYKTGRNPFFQKKPVARQAALVRAVEEGVALQAAVYARSGGPEGLGRYAFVSPNSPTEACEMRASASDDELGAALDATVNTLDGLRRTGAFLPRLLAPSGGEHRNCEKCGVSEACLRGDSGARMRLQLWAEARVAAPDGGSAAERIAFAGFQLAERKTKGKDAS